MSETKRPRLALHWNTEALAWKKASETYERRNQKKEPVESFAAQQPANECSLITYRRCNAWHKVAAELGLRNAAGNGTASGLNEARDAPSVPGDEGTTNVAEAGAKRAMAEQEMAPFI